jgi:hypothetical protein
MGYVCLLRQRSRTSILMTGCHPSCLISFEEQKSNVLIIRWQCQVEPITIMGLLLDIVTLSCTNSMRQNQKGRQCMYKRNIEARSRNHCRRGKEISVTYSECVSVALVIWHTQRMRHIILSSVACLAVPYFSILSHKRHDFRKNVIEHKICVLIFSTTFVWNISYSKRNSARYYHECTYIFMLSTRYSCQILNKFGFSQQIFEKYSNVKFHEVPFSGSPIPCRHTDGRTDGRTWWR